MKTFDSEKILKILYPNDWEEVIQIIKEENRWEEFQNISSAEELAHFIYTFMD